MTEKKERQAVGTALHLDAKRADAEKLKAKVLGVADDVFCQYIDGFTMDEIAQKLPFEIPGWKLRSILMNSEETQEQYSMAKIERAHSLVDTSVGHARRAAELGDAAGLRIAIDTNLKIAAKLHASEYGDKSKLELTGKDGNALEIKADLSLTAEQAYERLIKGA